MPRECLAAWFTSDKMNPRWIVPSNVKCHHGQYHPNASSLRLVSRDAFEWLKGLYDDWDGVVSTMSPARQTALRFLEARSGDATVKKPSAESTPPSSTESQGMASPTSGSDKENVPVAEGGTSGSLRAQNGAHPVSPAGENGSARESAPSDPKSPSPLLEHIALNASSPALSAASTALPPNPTTSLPLSSLPTPDRPPADFNDKVLAENGNCPDYSLLFQDSGEEDDDIQCLSPPAEFPELDICIQCVRDEYKRNEGDTRNAELVRAFNSANENRGPYLLPKEWLNAWTKNKISPTGGPTDPEFSLYCEHGEPFVGGKKCEYASEEAILVLRSVLGEFPVFSEDAVQCEECSAAQKVSEAEFAAWVAKVKVEDKLYKNHRNQSHVFGPENYLLPRSFFEQWEEYLSEPMERRPTLQLDLCEHGLLDFDPGLDKAEYIDKNGWEKLCQL